MTYGTEENELFRSLGKTRLLELALSFALVWYAHSS